MTSRDQAQTTRYYDSIAAGYNELHGNEQRRKLSLISQLLKDQTFSTILDVGAGTGIANEFYPQAVGVDPSPGLLAHHPNKESIVAVAEQLPFADKQFDLVLCVSAIHHTDYSRAIAEIARVTRKTFVITILRKSPQSNEILEYLNKQYPVKQVVSEDKDWIVVCEASN